MKILIFLAKVVFFIVATVMFIPAKIAYFDGADQKKWQATEALVTKSDLGIKMVDDIRAKHKNKEKYEVKPLRETYFWDVEYKYSFKNKEYSREGIYVTLKSTSYDKKDYETRIQNYPVDSKITVYVNPKNPEQAYIDRRTEGGLETWYNTTRFFFYLSILLFFIPLFKWFYKEFCVQGEVKILDEKPVEKTQVRKQESTIQRNNKYSNDGFDV